MKVRISLAPNKFAGGGEIPPYRTGDPSVLKRDLNNRVILPSFNDLFSNHRPEDIYEEEGYIPLEQGKGHQYTYNDIYTDYIGRLNKYNQSLPVNDNANILTNEKRTSQGLNRIGDTGAIPVVNDMFKGVNTLLGYGMQAPIELAKTALMPGSYIPYAGATNQMGELVGGAVDNAAGALFAPIMPSNYIDWGSAGRDGIHLKLPWQSNSNGVETPAFMQTMDFVAAPYLAKGVGKIAKWGKQYVNPFYESRNQPINLINERVNRILQTSSEPTTLMPERMEASVIEPARTSLLEPERTPEAYRTALLSPVRRTSSVSRDVQEPSQSIIEIPEPAEVLTSAELARLLRQLERQQNTHIAQEAPIQGFDWSAFDEYERGFLRPTTEEIVLPINRQRGYNDRSILNESLNAEDFKLELANDYGIPIKEIDHFLLEKGLDLNDLKVRRRLSWSDSDLENFAKSYKKDLYSRHPELAETLIEFISDKTGLNKNFIGELLWKLAPEYFLRNISEISNLNNFIDNYYLLTDSALMKMYSPKDYLSSDIYNELKKAMSDEEINNAFDKLLNNYRFIDYRDLQKIAAYPQQLKVSYSPIEGLNDIVALQEFSKNFGKHAHDNIERGEHNVFSKIRSGVRRAMNPEAELSINEPLDFNFSANSVNLILAMAKALSKERKALKRFPGMIQRNGDFRLRGNSYGNVNLGTKEEPKIGDIYGTIPTIEEMRTYPSRAEALLPINKNLAQTYKYFVENTQGEGMPLYHMDLKMLLDVIDAGGDVSKVPGAADATFTIGDDPTPIYMFGKFPETFNAPSYPNIRFVFNNGGSLSSNLFPDGGTLDDDDIPMYGSTQQEAVVTGHRMPAWNRFWNKNFRSKSGWDKYVDRYYARQQQMQDTNNTPNPNYEVPDALSIAGIIAGTPYNEDIERAKVWDTYNNWKEHSEIIGPHYDPDGNYHNDTYTNPSAGYLSNTDPVGEFFVLNEALGPLAKFIGRGTQQVMARAGNQWARNQIMGRAFNNAADASFGFNNRFVTTPASSMGYEMKPKVRTLINNSNPKEWTPEQWTAAQDAAIARGDMTEAQRLRDLHFMITTPYNKLVNGDKPIDLYHNTNNYFNAFDLNMAGKTDPGYYGRGIYTTPMYPKSRYGNVKMHLYANAKNPLIIEDYTSPLAIDARNFYNKGYHSWKEKTFQELNDFKQRLAENKLLSNPLKSRFNKIRSKNNESKLEHLLKKDPNDVYLKNIKEMDGDISIPLKYYEIKKKIQEIGKNEFERAVNLDNYDAVLPFEERIYYKFPQLKNANEIVIKDGRQLKSADAVTYDDNGIRIPLGERDNFNINDIRYGLAPLGFGIPYLMNNNNNQ